MRNKYCGGLSDAEQGKADTGNRLPPELRPEEVSLQPQRSGGERTGMR